MNNDKHTPGPWNYTVADHDHTDCEHAFDIVSERRPFVATVLGGADPGRSEANARLIAAAPHLLSALRCARAAIRTGTFSAANVAWMDEVLAMATDSQAT